jgi:presenilin-like A22 family membrane protease
MRALLRLMIGIIGIALLAFAVHEMSSSVLNAPQQLWNALGDATTWGVSYKVVATVVFIVCLAVLYVTQIMRTRRPFSELPIDLRRSSVLLVRVLMLL